MAPQPPTPLSLPSAATAAPASRTLSPTSPTTPQSPTERSFFGAISNVTSRARSRSRSKLARNRSRSPLPRTPMASPTEEVRPSTSRNVSGSSSYSTDPSLKRQSSDSSEWERLSYGRHSKDWLFGGFSITETAKDAVHHFARRNTDRPN